MAAESMVARLRAELGVDRLHAQQLGAGRLIPVAKAFARFAKREDVRFQLYAVTKPDYAVMTFFDQVFDAGMNEAVPWSSYWTPLRFLLMFKVAYLFDEDCARKAWETRLTQSEDRCAEQLADLCKTIFKRVPALPDERSREVISGALSWAIANPKKIQYGTDNRQSALDISPNLIGFQQVLQGIAAESRKRGREVSSIVVDRQGEFNTSQERWAEFYRNARGHKTPLGPGMPMADFTGMPVAPPEFRAGDESAGLEMVDTYLWVAKRMEEGRELPSELLTLMWGQRHRGRRDEISFEGLNRRWAHLTMLPEPDPKNLEAAEAMLAREESNRRAALRGISDCVERQGDGA